ncbi:MAG: hypothetical protein K2K49_05745 [Duncaniella sp.]|nr:hypothetical protein [Duncaniella sp.]
MTAIRNIYPSLLTALAALAILAPCASAQETVEADSVDLAGVVEIPGSPSDADIDIQVPSFIRRSANHIQLNGADWAPLRAALEGSARRPASIVMIGDSHIQADISSGVTRSLLQYDFGNAGRGLVSPLKMSGTNEPTDYAFESRNSWIPAKLMSQPWRQTVGFTGTSIRPSSATSEITFSTSERADDAYDPFSSVTIFHQGKMTVNSVTSAGHSVPFRAIPSHDYTQILLERPVNSLTVNFTSGGDLTIFGASLSADTPGVFYHAIGNNGAAYETYNRIGNVGAGIAPLSPDLVIVSLGTNEAFGRFDAQSFTRAVDRLVTNIRQANPRAQILLTTPMECQRSVTTTKKVQVKGKARKGRKARTRTVNRTSRTYAVNRNIAPIRQAILDYGKQNGIAVYDWYDVAGGSGASTSWIDRGLFAKDRVHHSRQGYAIEGRLLYEALMDAVRSAGN